MKKLTLIALATFALTGCLQGYTGDGPFEPYDVGPLRLEYPVTVDTSWDAYLNTNKTIREDEKMFSAQAVFDLVSDRFDYQAEPGEEDVWSEMKLHNMVGDCDEFAITCQKLLLSQHWNNSDVLILSSPTHLGCGVVIGGDVYILDNTESRVIRIQDSWCNWDEVMHNGKWFHIEY